MEVLSRSLSILLNLLIDQREILKIPLIVFFGSVLITFVMLIFIPLIIIFPPLSILIAIFSIALLGALYILIFHRINAKGWRESITRYLKDLNTSLVGSAIVGIAMLLSNYTILIIYQVVPTSSFIGIIIIVFALFMKIIVDYVIFKFISSYVSSRSIRETTKDMLNIKPNIFLGFLVVTILFQIVYFLITYSLDPIAAQDPIIIIILQTLHFLLDLIKTFWLFIIVKGE